MDFFRLDRDRDLRRDDILAAMEVCKTEILALKTKLIALSPEGNAQTNAIETKIDETLQDIDNDANTKKQLTAK